MNRDQQFEQTMIGYERWLKDGGDALINSELSLDGLMQAAFFGGTEYRPNVVDWRAHSAQFAKGENCPDTLETAQAAWARDQELIFEQKAEISKFKEKLNRANQRADKAKSDLSEALALLRQIQTCLAQGEAVQPNTDYEQEIYRVVRKHD